jgi:hypothetical protein
VQVDVEHFLASRDAVGQEHVDALARQPGPAQRPAELMGHGEHPGAQSRVQVLQVRRVLAGNDEQMTSCQRADIQERDDQAVLVDLARFDPPSEDLAEHAWFRPAGRCQAGIVPEPQACCQGKSAPNDLFQAMLHARLVLRVAGAISRAIRAGRGYFPEERRERGMG